MRVFTQVELAKYDSLQRIARCLDQLATGCLIPLRIVRVTVTAVLLVIFKLIFLPFLDLEAVEIDLADLE
jgi:hypothetical protein